MRDHHPILKVKKYTRSSQVHCLRTHTQRMSVREICWDLTFPYTKDEAFPNISRCCPQSGGKVRRQTLLDVTVSDYRNCKHVKNGKKRKSRRREGGRGERLHSPLTLRDHYCSPGWHTIHHLIPSLTSTAFSVNNYPHFPDGKIETMEFK